MRHLLFLVILTLLGCSDAAVQKELTTLKGELATAQEKIKTLERQIEPEGELVHLVFLRLKADADYAALVSEVKKLSGIKEVMDLEIGPFENLGDERALAEYSVLMQMSFTDKAAYETYQKHPIHVAVKENTKSFMAGPPATYDFMKQ